MFLAFFLHPEQGMAAVWGVFKWAFLQPLSTS